MDRTTSRRGQGGLRLRRSAVLGLFLLALATVVGAQAATSFDGGEDFTSVTRFQRIDPSTISKVEGWQPAWLAADRQVSVVVELNGAPVGQRVADARQQGKELSKAEKDAIRAELKARQDSVKGGIEGAGGTVLADYQDAYNGIGVRIALKDLAKLSALPGVVAVHTGRTYRPDNTAGAQYIRANTAWQNTGNTGRNVKVAILDTGVDYLHANFGGPGTKAAFDSNNGAIVEPGSFPTAKVIGGTDFVGDDYDAGSDDPAKLVPHPDNDPLDCNGHGSHVAGTAAGFGVKSDGSTFTGPYNGSTHSANSFRIGPGVAPEASIVAYRIFGCEGSVDTTIVVAAINRAVKDGADVINMSLGSPFGRPDEPDAVASNVAAEAGVVVVASAGNSGANAYITGSPASGSRVISVAAIDASSATFPGANLALNTGKTIQAINANNGGPLPPANTPVVVLRNADGTVSLGCNPAQYAGTAGKIVVTVRGTCARVARAVFGQKAGAAAVIMINNSRGLPPFEGRITGNPDTGEKFDVTIPFLGVRGVLGPAPEVDGDDLIQATSLTATATTVANPGYERLTSFSSGGPRNVDSAVKPDIAAPGQSVVSTRVGTGNEAATLSGTSMAAPMTTGTAALMTQAHPTWSTEFIKAALMNTSMDMKPSQNPRTGGAGVVQIQKAIDSQVLATTSGGSGTLSFGYQALTGAFSQTLPVTLTNTGTSDVSYNLTASSSSGAFAISFSPSSVTVPAGGTATVNVTLSVSAATAAALPNVSVFVSGWGAVTTGRGQVLATPTTSGAGLYQLRVPWLVAPRGVSNVAAGAKSRYQQVGDTGIFRSSVTLTNNGVHSGFADVYSWGIEDANDTAGGEDGFDVRSVGVQELPTEVLTDSPDPNDRALTFAINTFGRWSSASVNEFDIAIDSKGNSDPEFFVVGVDFGAVTTGSFDGRMASFIIDAKSGDVVDIWVADSPANGSTVLLPALASELGLTTGSSKLNYQVAAFPIVPEGLSPDITSVGSYRAFEPPVSSGDFIEVKPGESKTLNLQLDRGKFAGTTVRGWLVVTLDNANGAAQADQISAEPLPR